MSSILINGVGSDQVSVLDRAFQYGDGLFETIRITAGFPEYWQQHIDRLYAGCDRLKIPSPDQPALQAEAMSLCKQVDDGILKIIVTRGTGGRGYAIPEQVNVTRVVALFPVPAYPKECWNQGIVARVCKTRLGLNPSLAGLKHLNRLEQVLARAEWSDQDTHEGLMLDIDNFVIEGTMSNLFCVKDNEILTPDLSRCGVKGIMREQVFRIARRLGVNLREANITHDMLYESDEIFLTNSVIGIWPVRVLENHLFGVGSVSKRISKELNNNKHGMEDNVA